MKTVTETMQDADGNTLKAYKVAHIWFEAYETSKVYIARSASEAMEKAEEDDGFFSERECYEDNISPAWTVEEQEQ
mgnify:CR=1 FL=1